MSDTTHTEAPQLNPDAGIAAAATAESLEILNLLAGEDDAAGSCCGGSCCSA